MASIPRTTSSGVRGKYAVEQNTFKRTALPNPERRIDVEIGDAKQPDFKPSVKTSWFNNEYNRSIRAEEHPAAKVKTKGDHIVYETPDYDVVQYEVPDAGDEGGHELEWLLKKKPKTNRLNFTLRYKGDVRFYHQPALTQEEIDKGASQPENVVDSYAVYIDKRNHKSGGNNYATGKIEHIYRPKAIDANGVEQWCHMELPESGQSETNIPGYIEIPQEFLDTATYPVRI